MANEYKIYRGLSADELSPLLSVPAGTQEVIVSQPAGTRYWYGLRAVSSADVEEHNTHVLCRAEIDATSQLLPTALPVPFDITAESISDNIVRVGFSCEVQPGYCRPSSFEILGDSGSGTIDEENPLASISWADPARADFLAEVPAATLPSQFAVRAVGDGRQGRPGRIVTVAAPRQPAAPALL